MAPKKTKPVAKGRHLMQISKESGWGALDVSKAEDYGADHWEPDDRFQASGRFFKPPDTQTSEKLPEAAAKATPNVPDSRLAADVCRQELCLLVFLAPAKLESIVAAECEKIWKTAPALRPGKVVVSITTTADLELARSLRPILGCQVVVKEYIGFLDETFSEGEFSEFLKGEVQSLPWSGPLYALVYLSDHMGTYDPSLDFRSWLPMPSFRVHAVHTDVERPWSAAVCKSFAEGITHSFGWKTSKINPDIDILLEISEDSITVLIDVQPCNIVDPCLFPSHPLLNPGVACIVLQCATLRMGDIVLNGTCGLLDTSSEIIKTYPGVYSIVGDNQLTDVGEAVDRGNQWTRQRHVEGCLFEMETLPYRDNSVDVIIEYMPNVGPGRDGGNRRPFSRRLKEIARVCRLGSGRVVLLVRSESFVDGLLSKGSLWSARHKISTMFGSLECSLFYMKRNNTPIAKEHYLPDYLSQSGALTPSRSRQTSRSLRYRAGRSSTVSRGIPGESCSAERSENIHFKMNK